MKCSFLVLVFIVGLPSNAFAGDDLPWKFNMTPEEVASFTQLGPYRTFSNGDLETYNAMLDGKKQNFQFFFSDHKLRRIGVYLYEGQDEQAAAEAWLDSYRTIIRHFGNVETPQNTPPTDMDGSAFRAKAIESVDSVGKIQMAPIKQPANAFVFSSFFRSDVQGQRLYDVVLYFDRPTK